MKPIIFSIVACVFFKIQIISQVTDKWNLFGLTGAYDAKSIKLGPHACQIINMVLTTHESILFGYNFNTKRESLTFSFTGGSIYLPVYWD